MSARHIRGMLLFAIAACAFAVRAHADEPAKLTEAERTQLLAERDKWGEESQRLEGEGKIAEAIAAANKMLAIELRLFGERHEDVAGSYGFLGKLHEGLNDFAAAVQDRTKAFEILWRLPDAKGWRVIEARLDRDYAVLRSRMNADQRARLLEADRLRSDALRLSKEKKMAEAVAAVEKELLLRQSIVGTDHFMYAMSLYNLSLCRGSQGERGRAEELCRQAVAGFKRVLGETHPVYAQGLESLARMINARGDFAGAEPLFRRALEIIKKAYDDTYPDYIASLNDLAAIYFEKGDYGRAEPLYREAMEISKRMHGDKHPAYADRLNELGRVNHLSGDYAEAERRYLEALEIRSEVFGEAHASYAASLNQLGLLYALMGDKAKAAPCFRKAIEINNVALGEAHPDYATNLNNLAELYRKTGEYESAEPLYRKAMEIRRKALGETHADYAQSLNNLGLLYDAMGDFARAEPLFKQALAIGKETWGQTHPNQATVLNNLAALYKSLENFSRAEPLFLESTEIIKQCLGPTHPLFAANLDNLAELYREQRDYARAEPLFQQALEIRKKSLGEHHPEYATNLNNLALVHWARGDYSRAERGLIQASEIWKKTYGGNYPFYAQNLVSQATLFELKGDHARANRLYHDALRICRENLRIAATVQSERQQLMMLAQWRSFLDALIALSVKNREFATGAFTEVFAWKGQVLERQRATRAVVDRPELAPAVAELREMTAQLATLILAPAAASDAAARIAKIADLSRQKENLEGKLSQASRDFRAATKELSLSDLQGALPSGAALVDFLEYYFSFPKPQSQGGGLSWELRLAAFVVKPQGEVELADLGPMEPLREAIALWRKDQGASPASRLAGQLLREQVWLPVAKRFGTATTILISPDQDLAKLPFAALPGSAPGKYLIEEFSLVTIPAPQSIVSMTSAAAQPNDEGGLLVVGGVDYDRGQIAVVNNSAAPLLASRAPRDSTQPAFSPLAGGRAEVAAIAGLFRETHPNIASIAMEGAAATQAAVALAAPKSRYLHLATHGYFAAERFKSALEQNLQGGQAAAQKFESTQTISGYHPGLLSGLALAGANHPDETDDGILTAEETGTLNLSKVDLVVLSACETGLGDAAGGEGLMGLQRAFQAAGARSVVASLWSVPDQATKLLMVRFYENLWKRKMGRLEALREAQVWMLQQGAERPEIRREMAARGLKEVKEDGGQGTGNSGRLPPYFWAAFVLSGDWR